MYNLLGSHFLFPWSVVSRWFSARFCNLYATNHYFISGEAASPRSGLCTHTLTNILKTWKETGGCKHRPKNFGEFDLRALVERTSSSLVAMGYPSQVGLNFWNPGYSHCCHMVREFRACLGPRGFSLCDENAGKGPPGNKVDPGCHHLT